MARTTGATATWVPNVECFRQLAEQHPTALADAVPVTADASLGWVWRQEGVAHTNLWRFVTLEDQLQVADDALHLADTWLLDLEDVTYRSVSLAQAARGALLYTFRDVLLATQMAAGLFDSVAPRRLVVAGPVGPVETALCRAAKGRDIVTSLLATGQPPATRQSLTTRLGRNLKIVACNSTWSLPKDRQRNQPTVIVFGSGADFVNQQHLVEQLRATRPYRVVHVAVLPPQASAYSRSWTERTSPALVLPPYTGLRQFLALRALSRDAWQRFQAVRPALEGRWPVLSHLDPVFRRFFLHTLSRVGGVLGSAERLLDAYRPDLLIVSNDSGPRERAIVLAARQRGIPSAQLIHSGFNDLHFRRFVTDELWVWGEVHRRQFQALGVPQERLRITGNPNYDHLALPGARPGEVRGEVRSQLGVAEEELLLLLITAKPPNLLTFVDMEQHVLDLAVLCEALGPDRGVRLAIKPHPRYDDTAVYRGLADRYPWVTVLEGWLLDRLLPACDGALMANTATTGAIEALLFGKPVIWIRPSTRYPSSFAIFDAVVLSVENRADIAPTLQRFVAHPEFREAVRQQGQAYLPQLVANLGANATEAAMAAIDQVMQQGRRDS